jgi:glycogen operon protein
VLHRRKFFQGRAIRGSDVKDVAWFDPDGKETADDTWKAGFVKCLGVRLTGGLIGDVDERGEPITGDTLLVLFNAHHEGLTFRLPDPPGGQHWELIYDTAAPQRKAGCLESGEEYALLERSLALLRVGPLEDESPVVLTGPADERGALAMMGGVGRSAGVTPAVRPGEEKKG